MLINVLYVEAIYGSMVGLLSVRMTVVIKRRYKMKPIKKMLIGLNDKGELDVIETNEDEEGMFHF